MRGFISKSERIGIQWLPLMGLMRMRPVSMDTDCLEGKLVSPGRPRDIEPFEFVVNEFPDFNPPYMTPPGWLNFTSSIWTNPCVDFRPARNAEQEMSVRPDEKEVVEMPSIIFDWLAAICKDRDASWLGAHDHTRRRLLLNWFNLKMKLDKRTTHMAVIAKLRSGNERVFVMQRLNNDGKSARYRVVLLDVVNRSLREFLKPRICKVPKVHEDAKGWNEKDFLLLVRSQLTSQQSDDMFINSLSREETTLTDLRSFFSVLPNAVWAVFPENSLRIERREVDVGKFEKPVIYLRPTSSKCPDGVPPRNWYETIDSLKSRAHSPRELVDLVPNDFFAGPLIARGLMANALITTDTGAATQLIHLRKDGKLHLYVLSHAEADRDDVAHLLVCDDLRAQMECLQIGRVEAARSMSPYHAQVMLQEEIRARRPDLFSEMS